MIPGRPTIAEKLLFILLLLGTSLAWAQTPGEQVVLELSRKKFDWLINKQYDSLEKSLDDRVQYIHSNGWIQNKKEIMEDARSGKLVYQKVTIKESAVRLYDKTAIVTGLGMFEGMNSGTAFSLDLRYTETYVKAGSRWKLASRHSNRMP